MGEHHASGAETIISVLYIGLVLADVIIVADIVSGGNLYRWWKRQTTRVYRWATEPLQQEAEVRREAAWVIWEAMQLLEDANG